MAIRLMGLVLVVALAVFVIGNLSPAEMGKLSFSDLEVRRLGDTAALVLGRWALERDKEPVEGNFTLVMEQIDGQWLVVHDHTSRQAAE